MQGSRLDEHGCHGTAALVEASLDGHAASVLVGVGAQVEAGVCGEQNGVQDFLDADALLGRHVDEHDVSAVFLGDESEFGELLAHLLRVGAWLVDLVHCDHDRHVGGLGVVERLNRLRHDAVVRRDHEDRDVGDLRTTGTHGGERLVARCVDEGDGAFDALVLGDDLVRTDVLGDSAGFARGHLRVADGVEERGLTVVDVTHDRDDGRPGEEFFVGLVFELLVDVDVKGKQKLAVLVIGRDHLNLVAELAAEHVEGRLVEGLRRRRHFTEVEQHGNQVSGARVDLVGEVRDRRAAAQTHHGSAVATGNAHATQRRGLAQLELCPLRPLGLASLVLAATATERTSGSAAGAAATATCTATTGRTGRAETGGTGRRATGALEAGTCAAGAARCSAGTLEGARTLAEAGRTRRLAGSTRTGRTGARRRRARDVARGRGRGRALAHALCAGERVVAGARARGLAHALVAGEGVVAGARGRRLRNGDAGLGCDRGRAVRAGCLGIRHGRSLSSGCCCLVGRCGLLGGGGLLCGLGLALGDRQRSGRHRRCVSGGNLDGDLRDRARARLDGELGRRRTCAARLRG